MLGVLLQLIVAKGSRVAVKQRWRRLSERRVGQLHHVPFPIRPELRRPRMVQMPAPKQRRYVPRQAFPALAIRQRIGNLSLLRLSRGARDGRRSSSRRRPRATVCEVNVIHATEEIQSCGVLLPSLLLLLQRRAALPTMPSSQSWRPARLVRQLFGPSAGRSAASLAS